MNKETEKGAWHGAFDAFGKMWERIKANPEPAIIVIAAYLMLVLIEMITVKPGHMTTQSMQLAGFEFVFLLFFLLALPTYGLALATGKKISVREFLRPDAKKYFAILGASILYSLAVIVALLLFIVPAIWAIAWFALYQMVIIDKNLGPVAALKESKRLIGNHKGKVWGIIGASLLLSIGTSLLSFVPLIGTPLSAAASVVLTILTTAVVALLYRWVR